MTDLRENLGWLLGSIATAIAMAVGWFISSGVVVNLLFLLIGSGITYFVQTRTQKRAWKREYSVKIAEEVYGCLFKDVKWIIQRLEGKYYEHLSFQKWKEIQEDHRYFMVDEKFRNRLDEFSQRVEEYNTAVIKLKNTILPKIANEETERVFNVETDISARLEVQYVKGHHKGSTSPNIIGCLISRNHPRYEALRGKTEISDVECFVEIPQRNGKVFRSNDLAKFNEFWKSCLRRMRGDKTYKFVIEETDNLTEETRKVKKEIVKRIEEPWKI